MHIDCIYCENTLNLGYYLRHLDTKKHIKKKKKLIDESMLFLPKEINNLIFEFWDDTPLEINRYKQVVAERIRIRMEEERQRRIDNIWYNRLVRNINKFTYQLFHPYD